MVFLKKTAAIAMIAGIIAFSGYATSTAEAATDEEISKAFNQADLNSDGHIEIDEFVGYMVNLFATVDTDRDGYLVSTDVADVSPQRYQKVDYNDDTRISLGEAMGEKVIIFFDSDQNNDGVMSLQELLDYEHKIKAAKGS